MENGVLGYEPDDGKIKAMELRSGETRISLHHEETKKLFRKPQETTTISWERVQTDLPGESWEYHDYGKPLPEAP